MTIHDIAIIGAGPCGLAIAARLHEPSPSALFTDIEHARFWNRKHDKNTIDNNEARKRKSKSPSLSSSKEKNVNDTDLSMIVFDANSTQWLSSWRSKFQTLNISHLRSPLFFHPDPRDRDGLLAFAHCEGRENELCEIPNVVGREVSKHEIKKSRNGRRQSARHLHLDNRDRNDYFTPSASLFDSYTDSIIERYDLGNLIQQATVTDIRYDHNTNLFKLMTTTKSLSSSSSSSSSTPPTQTHFARTVITATGPANTPQIPPSIRLLTGRNSYGSASHVFSPSHPLLPPHLITKLHTAPTPPITQILIVGGGLTSAQTTHLLLSKPHSISKIHLVLRSRLKIKAFDVDLPWVAKLRNREMARFWSADTDEERFEMLRDAKGGGSVTNEYARLLRGWERVGRLVVYAGWEIDAGDPRMEWDCERNLWDVVLRKDLAQSSMAGGHNAHIDGDGGEVGKLVLGDIDHIIFATSIPPNIGNVPFLQSLTQSHPIRHINGLPVLTEDLKWHDDVPLFVTGALAGLRLGPGAGNLTGARLGAERIAWGIGGVLARLDRSEDHVETDGHGMMLSNSIELRRDSGYASEDDVAVQAGRKAASTKKDLWSDYATGLGSRFASLALLD